MRSPWKCWFKDFPAINLGVGTCRGFLGGLVVKKPLPAREGDMGSIPGVGRSPRGGKGNPLLYSCQENPIDRGAWLATVHEVTKKSDMTEHSATCRELCLLVKFFGLLFLLALNS